MTKQRNVPYPAEAQKEQAIHFILSEMEERVTWNHLLKALWKLIGWRLITQQAFLYFVCAIALLSFLLTNAASYSEQFWIERASVLMNIPLVFALFLLFTFWKKKEAGTYELEMTTRYTVSQVLSVHLLTLVSIVLVIQTCVFAFGAFFFHMPQFWIVAFLMNGSILTLVFGDLMMSVRIQSSLGRTIWWGVWLCGNLLLMRFPLSEFALSMGGVIVGVFLLCALYVLFYQEVMRLCMRVERGDYYAYN